MGVWHNDGSILRLRNCSRRPTRSHSHSFRLWESPNHIAGDDGMTRDWYRKTNWSALIEQEFQTRFRRTRAGNRAQYLLIQAEALVPAHSEAALRLLNQYFALPMERPSPQAHVVRARALLQLGHPPEAIAAYEAALAREDEFPNILTQAYLELPCLIAKRKLRNLYSRARAILHEHEHRLTFPLERFEWNAANALILADQGNQPAARRHAQLALEAAATEHSGFRHHPSLGLVGGESVELIRRLEALAAG